MPVEFWYKIGKTLCGFNLLMLDMTAAPEQTQVQMGHSKTENWK